MEEEKRAYREGDEPSSVETIGTPEDEFEDSIIDEKKEIVPVTAFLLVKFDNRVDVVSDLPGMNIDHKPTMAEIRDMSIAVSHDAQITLLANRAAQVFTQSLVQAAKQQQGNRVIRPIGVPMSNGKVQ